MLIGVGHFVSGLKILAPKLCNLKTALVDIEMNVSLVKIGCAGLPNLGFGVECFYRLPRAIANAFAMLLGRNKKNLQLVVVRFFVDFKDDTAHLVAICYNAIGLVFGGIDATFNRFTRDDLTVTVNMIVALTSSTSSLLRRAILPIPDSSIVLWASTDVKRSS